MSNPYAEPTNEEIQSGFKPPTPQTFPQSYPVETFPNTAKPAPPMALMTMQATEQNQSKRPHLGMQLTLGIVSIVMAFPLMAITLGMTYYNNNGILGMLLGALLSIVMWAGIVAVNVVFAKSCRD